MAAFAKEDGEEEELYDYSTEKVRSLLKRDSRELKGVEELGESAQTYQPSSSFSDEDAAGGAQSPRRPPEAQE